MKPGIVSPDFFVYFRFHFQKAHLQYKYTWDRYFQLISKTQRIYQFIFDSSNRQCSIRVSYDMIIYHSIALRLFRPRYVTPLLL